MNLLGWASRAAVCCLLAGCVSDEESVERKCARLREHAIDLRVQGIPESDQEAHRTALRDAMGLAFMDQCVAMKPAELDCALGAKDVLAIMECSPPRAP